MLNFRVDTLFPAILNTLRSSALFGLMTLEMSNAIASLRMHVRTVCEIAMYVHHYLPFMNRYNADIKPIPLPDKFPRFTSENVAFRT